MTYRKDNIIVSSSEGFISQVFKVLSQGIQRVISQLLIRCLWQLAEGTRKEKSFNISWWGFKIILLLSSSAYLICTEVGFSCLTDVRWMCLLHLTTSPLLWKGNRVTKVWISYSEFQFISLLKAVLASFYSAYKMKTSEKGIPDTQKVSYLSLKWINLLLSGVDRQGAEFVWSTAEWHEPD